MKKIYLKYKGVRIVLGDSEGVLAGFSNSHFIVATEQKPKFSFRRLGKDEEGIFIEEEFKDVKYRYFYCLESSIISQSSKGKNTYRKIVG